MAWVRLDDAFYLHPKVVAAGPLGLALQVAALCYSNHYLTEGFITKRVVKHLLDYESLAIGNEDVSWQLVVALLLDAGLWEEVDGGYLIHDYAQYQPSRESILTTRAQKVAAGQAGGKASAQARVQAKGQANAQAKSKPVPVPVPVIARSVLPADPTDHPTERQPSPALAIRNFERADSKHASTQLVALGNAYGLSFSGKGGHLKKIIDRFKNRRHIVSALQHTVERLSMGDIGDHVEYLEGVLRDEKTKQTRPPWQRSEEERPRGELEAARTYSRSEIAAARKAATAKADGAGEGHGTGG